MYIHHLDPVYKSYHFKKSPRVIWGHRGQKFIFTKKCYNSSKLHIMNMRLIHLHQCKTLYLCYEVKCQSGVIWGHRGQKVIFTKKCSNSSMLHNMTIRLIHVDQLETIYLCHGVRCKSEVIWGHWGQKVKFTKMLLFVHVTQHGHKTHTCSSAWDLLSILWGQMSIWGQFPPADYAIFDGKYL